jgi:phosphate starvation-inducible PhoH-like protein
MKKRVRKHLVNHPIDINGSTLDFLEHFQEEMPLKHICHEVQIEKTHHLQAQNDKQREYIRAIIESPQVIVVGSSGTGKTYIASKMAVQMFSKGEFKKIILTKPNVSCSKSIGFFPGTLEEKISPWVVPFTDIFQQDFGASQFEYLLKKKIIDIIPFEVMRGRTFDDAFVIVDEAQNTSIVEIKMLLTRIGKRSKIILNGDIRQSDIRETSGLSYAIELANKYGIPVPVIEFTVNDIVRSDICALWVKAFEEREAA